MYTGAHHYAIEPLNILLGPITRNTDDAKLLFKLLLETQNLNQALVKVPFNQDMYDESMQRKHKIGFLMGIERLHGLCPTIV